MGPNFYEALAGLPDDLGHVREALADREISDIKELAAAAVEMSEDEYSHYLQGREQHSRYLLKRQLVRGDVQRRRFGREIEAPGGAAAAGPLAAARSALGNFDAWLQGLWLTQSLKLLIARNAALLGIIVGSAFIIGLYSLTRLLRGDLTDRCVFSWL